MSKTRWAGEFSSPWLCVSRSNSDGCSGLNSAACEMRRQKSRSAVFAPSRPPTVMPWAITVAFMAPALVALMPSNSIVSSSSRRSSTPQVKAPCAPPPWRARLMVRTRLASGRALRVAISTCVFMASSRSVRGPAAVDWQRRPGDRSRGFAREEDRQRADLLDGREALVRLLREKHVADHLLAGDPMRLRLAFDLRLDERRPDVARADGIAGDVLLGGLERRHLGEADDAVLCRHIGGLERRGDEPMREATLTMRPHPVLRIAGTAR